jgi:alpha,alpha-trehalose phosphorylase
VAGFGGMRDHNGALTFAPRLPERLSRLTFRLCFRGRRLKVEVDQQQARYSLSQGESLEIAHHGERFEVTAAEPVTRMIPPARTHDLPRQPASRAPARRSPAG